MLSGVTIGFDDLANGIELGGQYSSLGVDFSTAIVWSDIIHPVFPAHSAPNVAVDISSGISNNQELTATAVGETWSDIGAYVTGFSAVTLTANAADNSVLGTMSTEGSNLGTPNEWLEVSASNIAYATFSCTAAQIPAFAIDDLHFDTQLPPPDVALASSLNPSTDSAPVTFTATVSAASSVLPTPTGTVTFEDGSISIGSGQLNASGVATFTTSTLAVGTHSITAVYGGDTNFISNTSSPVTQIVNPVPTAKVTIQVNDTADPTQKITLFNPSSTDEPCTQTIPARITNTGTTAGTFQLSVQPSAAAVLLDSSGSPITSVSLTAGASTEVTIMPTADSSAPNDVRIIATQGGTQIGEDSMTIVGVTYSTMAGTDSLDIKNQDTPAGMPDRIPPFGPASTSITPLYITVTPNLAGSGQSISLTFLNQTVSNGFAAFENGAEAAVVTSSGMLNLTGLQQTAPADANNPANLSAPNASKIQLVVQVRGQNTLESHGFSVAAIPINFQCSNPVAVEKKSGIGMTVIWNLQSDSGTVADLGALEESERVAVVETSGPLRIVGTILHSSYEPTSVTNGDVDSHTISEYLLDLRSDATIEVDQLFVFEDARTGTSGVAIPNSGFIIRQDFHQNVRTHRWFLTTTKAGAPTTIEKTSTEAGLIVPPPFLTVTEKIKNQFLKHLAHFLTQWIVFFD